MTTENSSNEQNNVYFLSPSDNPGAQLVTQQLTGFNYNNWNRSMMAALMVKNKLTFVNGGLPRTFMTDPMYSQWVRCNSMVISWLRNAVNPDISSSIMYLEDASLVWDHLKDRFSQGDLARIHQLKLQLVNLQQGADDVGVYYTKFRILWDEYRDFQPISWCECDTCTCGSKKKWAAFQAQECAMQFLIGLNALFSQIRSNLLSVSPLIPVQKMFAIVMQEERQRTIEVTLPPPPPSFTDQTGFVINAASGGCGRGGRGKFLCTKCGKTNHTIGKCFEIIGFPPGYSRGRGRFAGGVNRFVNQVSIGDNSGETASGALSAAHMAQMFSYFQNQMQLNSYSSSNGSSTSQANGNTSSSTHSAASPHSATSPPFSGSFSGQCDWEG